MAYTKQIAALGFAGLLAVMAPAFAQGTGTGTTGTMGSGSTGTHGGTSTHGSMHSTASGSTSSSSKLSSADRKFIMDAAEGGMAEVQLGQLAASQASDPDVKAFGQRMVDDHTKANDRLKQIAADKGVTLPTELKGSMKTMHDKLSKASGASFDKMYMQHMVSDHKKDVSEFQKESKSGKDADVKQFASDTLPTLQDHLKMAQTTASKVGAAGSKSTAKSTKKSS
jgi:putative membrane protein